MSSFANTETYLAPGRGYDWRSLPGGLWRGVLRKRAERRASEALARLPERLIRDIGLAGDQPDAPALPSPIAGRTAVAGGWRI